MLGGEVLRQRVSGQAPVSRIGDRSRPGEAKRPHFAALAWRPLGDLGDLGGEVFGQRAGGEALKRGKSVKWAPRCHA